MKKLTLAFLLMPVSLVGQRIKSNVTIPGSKIHIITTNFLTVKAERRIQVAFIVELKPGDSTAYFVFRIPFRLVAGAAPESSNQYSCAMFAVPEDTYFVRGNFVSMEQSGQSYILKYKVHIFDLYVLTWARPLDIQLSAPKHIQFDGALKKKSAQKLQKLAIVLSEEIYKPEINPYLHLWEYND